MNTTVKRIGDLRSPERRVAFYDRAMYERGHNVAVAFFDGHVEMLDRWAFAQLINDDPNATTDFSLP
jgi:prepilin-type processing-associated H-X9-DG protein